MRFRDRFEAGRLLAEQLAHFCGEQDVVVLALPRGGVPVAYEVAKALDAPLDVFLVRELGVPGHKALAMAAVASGGVRVINGDVVRSTGVSDETLQQVAEREERELERQQSVYRRDRPAVTIQNRIVILVDDGLATGSTMRAAVQAIRRQEPKRLIVAVPVGAAETCAQFRNEVDEMICTISPEWFMVVGMWYEDFSPTPDSVVQSLLEEARRREERKVAIGEHVSERASG